MKDTVSTILGLHHVAIVCSDYNVSRHFYVDILGLRVLNETHRTDRQSSKLDLQLPDGCQLELFSFPNPPERLTYPEACGLRHLAFSVSNIKATIKFLQSHNIKTEPVRIDPITKRLYAFFYDPDRTPLEIYELEAAETG